MHVSVRVAKDERQKPGVETFYDHTKVKVNVVDLLLAYYQIKTEAMLAHSSTLAYAGHCSNQCTHYFKSILILIEFFKPTWKILVLPHVERRYYYTIRLQVKAQKESPGGVL